MEEGKVPTTPTTASVIAGIQCQEAVKYLHGLEVLVGQGYVFDGVGHQSYLVSYARLEDCPSHEPYSPIDVLPWRVDETPVAKVLERIRTDLGPDAVLESNQDLLAALYCARCDWEEPTRASLGKVTEAQGRCPRCQEHRAPKIYHTIDGSDRGLMDFTLGALGVPAWDIVGGRSGLRQHYYEFGGDREPVLGPLSAL
jgi:adenylyltransferase/sulfurtransferase